MNTRIQHKHITQWQKPFRDAIAQYNGKIHKCQRWRNRRKAQDLNKIIWRKYKKQFS